MDSEVAHHHHHHGEHEHEHIPLDSTSNLHESSSINSSDLAPTDSFNGDLQPSSLPLASKHDDLLSAEIKRSIADNQVLVDEIASLRDAHSAMEHTRELLQRELHRSSDSTAVLSSEIASLEVEKRKCEDLAACMAREVHALHAEKMDLQAENGNIASDTKCLDVMAADTKEKSSLLARDLDEKQVAMAAAQTRVHMICFEVETLQLEKEEYSKEISLLDASNGTIDTHISQLREEETALSNEVDQILAAKALTEQKVSDAQAIIAALSTQISTLTESDEDMQNKLCEAKERLRHLEEQDKAMALREREMETSIVGIQSRMHMLKANFDTTEQAPEQEEKETGAALEVTHMQVAASERDLHVLELPSEVQETDVNMKQQHVQDLVCRIADMREEKKALACSNEELRAELRKTQELEAEKSVGVTEGIKKLEGTLNEAEERAHLLESREIELKCKLQDLTIVAKRKPRLAGLTTPLIISGGTIVALGLLVYLLHSNSKSK